MKLHEAEIKFKDSSMNFKIYHNLPETFGLNIEGAVTNWQFRTEEYTAESLKNYILSKTQDCVVLTEDELIHFKNDTKREKRTRRK